MLISSKGLSLFPITSLGLDYTVSREIISSGIPEFDNILGGGFYKGLTVLISGTTGAGKQASWLNSPMKPVKGVYFLLMRSSRIR